MLKIAKNYNETSNILSRKNLSLNIFWNRNVNIENAFSVLQTLLY